MSVKKMKNGAIALHCSTEFFAVSLVTVGFIVGFGASWCSFAPASSPDQPSHSSTAAGARSSTAETPVPASEHGPLQTGTRFPTKEQARKFLDMYTAFPSQDMPRGEASGGTGGLQCGTWMYGYAKMHGEMRAGKVPGRYITWTSPAGGIGDQLTGIVSLFLASLVSGRALILHEGNLEAMFDSSMVDWKLRGDVPMETLGGKTVLHEDLQCNATLDAYGGQVIFPLDMQSYFKDPRREGAANLIIPATGGVVTRLFGTGSGTDKALSGMGLHANNTYACVLRFLLRPTNKVLDLAAGILTGQPKLDLCVHVRSKDSLDRAPEEERIAVLEQVMQLEINCAKVISDKLFQKKASWFVMADSQHVKDSIQEWSSNFSSFAVMKSEIRPDHWSVVKPRTKADPWVIGNAAEWVVFSTCPAMVFPPSGFSKTAFAYSPRRPIPFIVPINIQRPSIIQKTDYWNCSDPQPSPVSAFWPASGL